MLSRIHDQFVLDQRCKLTTPSTVQHTHTNTCYTHIQYAEWSGIQALCINIYCSFICLQKTHLSLSFVFGQPLTLLRQRECILVCVCVYDREKERGGEREQ